MIKLFNPRQPTRVYEILAKVIDSGVYVKGPLVESLEEAWAQYCGMKYAIGVSSGAAALELAIQVLFIRKNRGYEITYSGDTFRAVPNAIRRNGFDPVKDNYQPDIYAHHLHESKSHRYTPVLEDCSHVHGYKPIAGTAVFSFFPTKILGSCGDAGIIVTNSKEVYDKCRDLRSHGEGGTNARMDEIQAGILLKKLPHLSTFIERRQEIVAMYDKALDRKTPGEYHYAYCIPGSEEKKQKLLGMGIESAFYYTPEYMALPLNPYLTDSEVKEVIRAVKSL